MDRISSYNNYSAILSSLMSAESKAASFNAQVTSGNVGDDLKAYGGGAANLAAAQSLQARTNAYIAGNTVLENRLSMQDSSLTQLGSAGQGARDAIAHAIATGSGTGLMDSLQSFFSQAGQALNSQSNGEYLFAGGQTSTAPVSATSLSDLTAGATISNGSLVRVDQLDDQTTVKTGFLATDLGGKLFDAFKQIQAQQESAGFGDTLTADQTTFLTGMLSSFDAANSSITDATARNGLVQSQVDDMLSAQQDKASTLKGMVGNLAGVDMATAVSNMTQAQTTVQASAQVYAALKDVSLLNYLN